MITKSYWGAVQVNVELKLVNFKKSVYFVWHFKERRFLFNI